MAKAIATDMPRRKLLKLLAGGAAATVASRFLSKPAAAASEGPRCDDSDIIRVEDLVEGPRYRRPPINYTFPMMNFTIPKWPPINYTFTSE
jgi:hypothetical protein